MYPVKYWFNEHFLILYAVKLENCYTLMGTLNQSELLVSCTEPKVVLSVESANYTLVYAKQKCYKILIKETFWSAESC